MGPQVTGTQCLTAVLPALKLQAVGCRLPAAISEGESHPDTDTREARSPKRLRAANEISPSPDLTAQQHHAQGGPSPTTPPNAVSTAPSGGMPQTLNPVMWGNISGAGVCRRHY